MRKIILAGLIALLAAPALGQTNIGSLPTAGTLTGTETLVCAQGTNTFKRCTPAQIETYVASIIGTTEGRAVLNAADAAAVRAAAGVVIGTDVQAHDPTLDSLAAYSSVGLMAQSAADTFVARTLTAGSAKLAVTNGNGVSGNPTVDLGTVASTDLSDSAALYRAGGTDVAVADGGTGSSTASGARTNLGVAIGTDVQGYDPDLSTYAGITPSANVQTLLGSANFSAFRTSLGVAIGSDVQAYNATLAGLAGLSLSQGDILYRDASGLQRLAAGTAGQVLKTQGGGANPIWANSNVEVLCQSAVASSHTGDTNEFAAATCTIPAGRMGANDRLEISATFTYTSSANTKTLRIRLGGVSGTAYRSFTPTTTTELDSLTWIANRGATNSQIGTPNGQILINQAATANPITSAKDMTASQDLVFSVQLALSSETATLEAYAVKLVHAPS